MKTPSPGVGRPRKRERDEPRQFVGFPVPVSVKNGLEAAAKANGRSLSAEAALRLKQSLDAENDAFFPPRLRPIIQNIAATFAAAGAFVATLRRRPELLEEGWLADPRCYRDASLSAARMLWRHDPEPNDLAAQRRWLDRLETSLQRDAAGAAAEQASKEPEADSIEAARRLGLEIIDTGEPPDPEPHQ